MTTLNRNFVVKNGIEVGSTANVGSTLGVTGATTLANTLAVTGNTTLSNTLTVTGLASFNGGVALGDSTSDQIAITATVNTDIIPTVTGADSLGNTSNRWLNVFANNLTLTTNVSTSGITTSTIAVSGLASLNGGVALGDATSDQISITGVVNTNIIPSATGSKDLGNTSTRWSTIWANNLTVTTNVAAQGITATDMVLSGNLTVSGTTTFINTTNLDVGDNIVTLNADLPGATAPTENSGFTVNRGSAANVSFLWDETADKWTVSNTSVTGTLDVSTSVNTASYTVGSNFTANTTGVYTTGAVNAASYAIGSNFTVSSTNLNHTGAVNAASYAIGSTYVANTLGLYHTGTVNAASHTVGSNFIANTIGVYTTGTVNAASFTTSAITANTTALVVTGYANVTSSVNSAAFTIGSAYIANTTGTYHTGTMNAASYTVGSSFIANTTGAYHTGTVNAASHTAGANFVANTTGVYHSGAINAASHTIGSTFVANTTGVYHTGTANLVTIGTTNIYVGNSTVNTVISNGAITINGVNVNTAITSNATAAYTNATSYADTKAAAAYTNATSYADTKAATAYSNATSYADTKAAAAYSNATSYADTAAATAYSNAVSQATSLAGTAYTNATNFAANASNISSGTLADARLSANVLLVSDSKTLSGNLIVSGTYFNPSANTKLLGNTTARWVLAANTGDFSGAVTMSSTLAVTGNVTGADATLTRMNLKDTAWSWNDSNTVNTIDYTNGSVQRWAPTAASNPTLTVTNWPASGTLGELLIEGVNLSGAGTVSLNATPTWSILKSDGTYSNTFSGSGVTLTTGTDWLLLWTRDGGTNIYLKVMR